MTRARNLRRWTAASAWRLLPPTRQRAIVDLLRFDAENVRREDPTNEAACALAYDLDSAADALELLGGLDGRLREATQIAAEVAR